MTVLVTVNRYVAVCHPYAASDTNTVKRQARLHVALVATFSVLFNVTRFFEWEIEETEETESGLRAVRTWLTNNLLYKVDMKIILAILPTQRMSILSISSSKYTNYICFHFTAAFSWRIPVWMHLVFWIKGHEVCILVECIILVVCCSPPMLYIVPCDSRLD